jgi:Domain of unknown function (DUF4174)
MSLLENYQWRNRLILVFAPAPEDELYQQQLEHLSNENELLERDLIVSHIFADQGGFTGKRRLSEEESETLREMFKVDKKTFAVVLIGKDGTEKQCWQEPVKSAELYSLIDAMPMRQEEMR